MAISIDANKISLYLYYALIIIIPLFFTWITYESFYIPKRFAFQAIISIIFLYAVISTISLGYFPFQNNTLVLPVLIFSVWGILSLKNSINIHVSLTYYPLFFSLIALFFLTLYIIPHTDIPSTSSPYAKIGVIERLLNLLIIVSTISAIIGILQFLGLNYEHGVQWKIPSRLPEKTDIYSTFGNPNFMSSFLAAVFPVVLINLWHNFNDIRKRYWYAFSALIILLCILISRTKAAWIGVIISIVLLFLFAVNIKYRAGRGEQMFKPELLKKILKASGILVLVIIALIAGISLILPLESNPILAELSSLKSSNITIKGRELMWKTTLNMIKDYPFFGLGVNTFGLNYQNYQGDFLSRHPEFISYLGSAESPHNQYLEIASEQGIIGLLLFIWINVRFYRNGAGFLRSEADIKEKMIVTGIMAGISTILIHSLLEFPLNLVPNAMLFWLYLGFVMIITNKQSQQEKIKKTKERISYHLPMWLSSLATIISIAASLFFIRLSLRPVIASKIHKDAWYLMRDQRWSNVITSAKKGIRFDQLNDELHLFLGVAYYQLGKYTESLTEYSKAYELYPDYMIPFNIGLIYKKKNELGRAEEYFKMTLFLRPNLYEAYVQLSDVYKEMGRIDESTEILNKGARYRKF